MTEPIAVWGGLPVELWQSGGLVAGRVSGALYIYPGEIGVRICLDPAALRWRGQHAGAPAQLVVRQQGGPLDVNHCFFPPWLNTAILIRDTDLRAVVKLSMWSRPKLTRALAAAGIERRWHRQVLLTLNADPLPPRRLP